MWRKKKALIIALLATMVLAGSIGGVIIAQAADGTASGNATQPKTLLARVAEIMGIDQTKLEAAVKQAQGEAQTDALKNRLQALVNAGKITQAQADEYLQWSQSKPDMAPYQQQLEDWQQARPTVPPDLKNWEQSKPNIPLPGGPGGPGKHNMRGMMGGQGGMMGGQGGMMGGAGGIGMMGGLALPIGPVQ